MQLPVHGSPRLFVNQPIRTVYVHVGGDIYILSRPAISMLDLPGLRPGGLDTYINIDCTQRDAYVARRTEMYVCRRPMSECM